MISPLNDRKRLLGVYIASKSEHGPAWQTWRTPLAEMGVEIISTWIDESCPGETPDMADLWVRCVREVASCDLLIAVHFEDEVWKGAFVEIGVALAAGRPVYVVGAPPGSWVEHPLVAFADDIADAVDDFRQTRTTMATDPEREHLCDAGCDAAYCLDCGEGFGAPCPWHRSFGHVPSADPYGDNVACPGCCQVCGAAHSSTSSPQGGEG